MHNSRCPPGSRQAANRQQTRKAEKSSHKSKQASEQASKQEKRRQKSKQASSKQAGSKNKKWNYGPEWIWCLFIPIKVSIRIPAGVRGRSPRRNFWYFSTLCYTLMFSVLWMVLILIFILHSVLTCSLIFFKRRRPGCWNISTILLFTLIMCEIASVLHVRIWSFKLLSTHVQKHTKRFSISNQICLISLTRCYHPEDILLFVSDFAPSPYQMYKNFGAAAPLKCDEYVWLDTCDQVHRKHQQHQQQENNKSKQHIQSNNTSKH